MAQLDPRRQPVRLTPMVFVTAAALTVGTLIWRVFQPLPSTLPAMDPSAVLALETRALAEAAARPGFAQPTNVQIMLRAGETLSQALTRSGVSSKEAQDAVALLSQAFDVVNLNKGMSVQAAIARPEEGRKPAQLLGLTVRTGPAKQLTLTTSHDGTMRLRALEESVRDERRVAIGTIDGSLITSATALGATPNVTGQVLKLFAHKIDFERDIKAGDTFKLVFDRKVTESGRVVESGNLLYAEINAKGGVTRFYSYKRKGDKDAQFFDEAGKNIKGFLLATPVAAARTSSGFGMRRHPIQGFMKMHTGIDFAAGTGTPIYAAGDGVVADAKWWGGYGRWVRIAHNKDWATGYAHMSQIRVRPGQMVRQGDLIGYVGSTGNSTGPHLHFEVWYKNHPMNPKDAKVPQGTILAGNDLVVFNARKHEIDSMIAMADQKRTQDNAASQTLAMKASPYQYEETGAANKLVAKTERKNIPLRPALSSTRGSN
ncbi:peptidoglycan DD-metalloendopeptidase family protein [Asticcacaulis sp. BYS171W]|uniref:Peptidoglycan DD-metalloendopeptidase family protein n=1 Tax=Asticcacaulis aquaticus TaxID=2984212 RepID=A0ABT5HXT1_9CAUL|nr:peptidoglycan DD-metalloendopeptidase family protein [Asticcacaulis aquaticus]MDC7684758.1 peptidoglycan DD-metalloendopeptidase family protein [Asticcacaulis aquaticus]